MLQCKLSGKAQEVCASLSLEESVQYEAVKAAILRAYELVPEHYRQRFRTSKRGTSQTYVEFAREKGILFDRWTKACKVTDYNSLRELLLIEEFKNCVPERTALYLNEQKVSTVQQAAVLADEYALMHKTVFYKRPSDSGGSAVKEKENPSDSRSTWSPPSPKSNRECSYCHKMGHSMAECRTLKRKHERQDSSSFPPRGSVLVKTLSPAVAVSPTTPDSCFKPFIFSGFVSVGERGEDRKPVRILRDTGGSQSFILADVLDFGTDSACNTSTVVQGIEMGFVTVPLHRVHVSSELASGCFEVAVRPSLPVRGVDFIMGNDIAGGKVMPVVQVVDVPHNDSQADVLARNLPGVFSAVVTRAQAKHDLQESNILCDSVFPKILGTDVLADPPEPPKTTPGSARSFDLITKLLVSRETLIEAQREDLSLTPCRASAEKGKISLRNHQFYWHDKVLMRHWSRSLNPGQQDDWNVVHQIVVPSKFRSQVLELAHDHPWSGHLGITKTYNRVLQYFFWPGLKTDVAQYCKTCHICQVNGKPNQVVPPAPLCPIPAVGEPFERVLVDCVGPLPRAKSGCQYLLTIMCVATRFPEAIPLRNITAKTVTKALTKFFTTFGLPKTVQTDQGSNFMSRVFRTSLKALGVAHVVASAYHPESQGALERWHQTLKSALRKYCTETGKEWDDGVPLVLFAVREARQDSLGFSPAELVFGHDVRGPLKMLKEEFLDRGLSAKTNVLELVSRTRERLRDACNTAKEALSLSQKKMKKRFDTKAVVRRFLPGDKVLVLFPIHGTTLSARFSGPYVIKGKQVGNGQVRPRDGKVAAVLNYPTPTTRRELRRFLGMVGYYRCFCKNFSTVVAPLTTLCSPKVGFLWTNECEQAFLSAKSLLCSAPVLSAPDLTRPFQLEVDASAVGVGAVLLQEGADNLGHPVSYFSAKFNSHQLNYSTIEKETLALLLALQQFNVYVGASASPVVVYTDHNPLVFLSKMYNQNQRLMRWALMVQPYNLEIRHKRGSDNVVADALSRGLI
nr:uncharacterized protein LOC120809370 isoform X2 [Gasterosteus aculeatus aculeatus]